MTVELDNAALCSYNIMYDATLLDMGNIRLDQALFIIPHIISAQHNTMGKVKPCMQQFCFILHCGTNHSAIFVNFSFLCKVKGWQLNSNCSFIRLPFCFCTTSTSPIGLSNSCKRCTCWKAFTGGRTYSSMVPCSTGSQHGLLTANIENFCGFNWASIGNNLGENCHPLALYHTG